MTTPRTVWETFYGLYTRPFSLTPDLRFEYQSQSHTKAVHEVSEALQRREGLVIVTGQVGTGKTMLCRTLLETIEKRTFKCVILDPLISAEELIIQVLSDFGLLSETDPARREPMTDVTRHRLVTTLQQFLSGLVPLDAHAVLLIDEAQHCNAQVLEEVRLLSNFETDEAKLLQIVLVGQPTLETLLEQPELRQLRQRVARRIELHPLTKLEVHDYVERRLAVASERPASELDDDVRSAPVEFDDGAISAVAAISHGVPRVVNTLCDRALQSAFERESPIVNRRAVLSGARHLQLSIPPGTNRAGAAGLAAAAALVLAIAGGGWWWWTQQGARTAPAVGSATSPSAPVSTPVPPAAPAVNQPVSQPPASTPPEAVGAATPTTPATTAPSSGTPAAAPSATTPAAVPPAATATAPGATPRAPSSLATPQFFEITVASFRTSQRADQVADDLATSGMPVSTKPDASGWYRVIAGPYPTMAEAEVARGQLLLQGFSGTRIIAGTPARE